MVKTTPLRVAGADVCRGRWLAVVLADGAFESVHLAPSLDDLAPLLGAVGVLALDIPIGLPTADDWPRCADIEAKDHLGPRRSSVFYTPPRQVLADCRSYDAANSLHRELTGKGLSRQTWGICARIREADRFAASSDLTVVEVHPEVSFRHLHGSPLPHAKKTWSGQMLRRRLLADAGIHLPDELPRPADTAPADDLLDAAVSAWSADRFARGEAVPIGTPTPDDQPTINAGRIWY